MQYFPIAKYIAVNIFLWAVFLGLQCTCHSYGGLFACRFLLGASEGCITTGIMTIISMFYTRVEVAERVGWTFQCNGFANIISGFVSFGVAHVSLSAHPRPWQWFMIIISLLSVRVSGLYFWRMPDNPTTARCLEEDEKRDVVERIRVTQNGVESKRSKKYQFVEAFRDPKSYLFFFAAIATMVGGIGVEYQIILKGFGSSTLQTTILNVPSGMAQVISVTLAGLMLRRWPEARTWTSAGFWGLAVIGGIVLISLPLEGHKVVLLIAVYITQMDSAAFVMMLSLCAVATSGHTKKMTVNAIFLFGYALGQMLAPQFWKVKYRPRNIVPWTILLTSYYVDIIIVLLTRWYLHRQNQLRDREKVEQGIEYDEYGYIEHVDGETGKKVKVKVPLQYLDITDWENRAFRYAL